MITNSRAVLVIDRSVPGIQASLRERNFRVIAQPQNFSTDDLLRLILPHRILITTELGGYLNEVSSYEFGVILLEEVATLDPVVVARVISEAFLQFKLASRQKGFLVRIADNGDMKCENFDELNSH